MNQDLMSMNSMTYRELERKYQNKRNGINIGQVLIKPCLEECKLYRRGTAYFSSSSLKSYAEIIDKIIDKDVTIQILCSPVIQDQSLINSLKINSTPEKREKVLNEAKDILLTAVGFKEDPQNRGYRSKVLSYMIAKGQLEIKFAVPKDYETMPSDGEYNSTYHVKNGYFEFHNDDVVAFDGSFNESRSGHVSNRERTQVFRSWVDGDKERLEDTQKDVDLEWGEDDDDIDVYPLDDEVLKLIKKVSPGTRPTRKKEPDPDDEDEFEFWEHQEEAIEEFLDKKKGILEMATGTGKTTTSLEIVRRLIEQNMIDSVIISTYGTSLLSQWVVEVQSWAEKLLIKNNLNKLEHKKVYIFKDFGNKYSESNKYLSVIKNSILVTSNDPGKLKVLLSRQAILRNKQRILIIYDEIHNFGSEKKVTDLEGLHEGFEYKLGLSATPSREYDEEGTEFIFKEIGRPIYQFGIDKAIKKGILCEFNYHPLDFEYTASDKEKIKSVYARLASSAKEGKPWTKERLWRELSTVRKKAENKPPLLFDFLTKRPDLVKSSIFFVDDSEQGDEIARILKRFTNRYTTFYQGAPDTFIKQLAKDEIDAVIACERLNEGVDIKSLKNIFLISTPKAKLVTVQRMGRCLRVDPNNKSKISNIIDFILSDNSPQDSDEMMVKADTYRKQWISELSEIKKEKDA